MAVTMDELILLGRKMGCSDIHLTAGQPTAMRINGQLQFIGRDFSFDEAETMIKGIMSEERKKSIENAEDVDFALTSSDGSRQRVNVFRQRGGLAAVIRLINDTIPTLDELGLPPVLRTLADQPRGLILVTGPAGAGKSTTLAAMIEYINMTRAAHILTIEDPVEYVYEMKKSVIHQREVGRDVKSFSAALRSALREDPDIILVGEMRDYETISAAVTAAETGHLVMSTMHTTGAAQTIDRITDSCPAEGQNQIRTQLASILKGVVTQTLIPTLDLSGRAAATEILMGTDAALNLIRENKCYQLGSVMQSGAASGMHTLNGDLYRLVREGVISRENAFRYSNDKRELEGYFD